MIRTVTPFAAVLLAGTLNAQLVINEVDYDQQSTDNAEYLELKNTGSVPLPLGFLEIVMVNGNDGAEYRNLSNAAWPTLAPGEYFVVCANNAVTSGCDAVVTPSTNLIQNGPADAIVLVLNGGPEPLVLDALSYAGTLQGYAEGTGTTAEDTNTSLGVSIGRFPDGSDTDDNDTDFRLMCSTPGEANLIDPVQCDLSTSIAAKPSPAVGFTAILAPNGADLLVYDANVGTEPLVVSLIGADGRLLAQRSASVARASFSFPAAEHRGSIVLVLLTSPSRKESLRVVVP